MAPAMIVNQRTKIFITDSVRFLIVGLNVSTVRLDLKITSYQNLTSIKCAILILNKIFTGLEMSKDYISYLFGESPLLFLMLLFD